MKKLIMAVALAVALPAQAEVYVAKNQGGGEIVLTTRNVVCKKWPALRDGYTYIPQGKLDFCWALIDGLIHAVYDDGTSRVYQPEMFTRRETQTPSKGSNL
jgi:hypothetical protein